MESKNSETTKLQCSFFQGPIGNVNPYDIIAFNQVYTDIRSGKYKRQIELLRAETDSKKQAAMKRALDYFTPSVICTVRNSQSITAYTGVLCIDLDGKDNPTLTPEKMRALVMNDPLLHAWIIFKSPLNKGIKILLLYDAEACTVEDYSHAVMQYMADACHLRADKACSDPTRACFMSYDPEAYMSISGLPCAVDVNIWLPRYNTFQGMPETIPAAKPMKYVPSNNSVNSEVAAVTENEDIVTAELIAHAQAVSARINIDIAPNYDDFLRLGLSLATLGEAGRPVFKHCCSFYSGEQSRDLDKYFTDCMIHKRGDVKIGSFFELCHLSKIDISMPKDDTKDEVEVATELENLPTFPAWVFDERPPLLKKIISNVDSLSEKSMLLMTALEIVKVLNKHSGFAYRYLVDDKPKVSSMQNMTPQYRFYNSLPNEFTTTKAVEVGDKLKIGRSTIHRYVHQFAEGKDDTGRIIERIGHGVYRKILDK